MKTPIDVFTNETYEFVSKHINPKGLKILEIGCGSGEFGLALQKAGASITAIDTDKKAIKLAKEKGLNAQNIDFLDYNEKSFDVLIFTRSLHHIHEIEKALKHANNVLKPNGKLLLEEFALENVNFQTTRWYYDMLSLFSVSNLSDTTFEDVDNPLRKWEEEHQHEHELHTGEKMVNEIKRIFRNVKMERNSYLYRSICSSLTNDKSGYEITKHILSIENRLIEQNLILPNGIRVVAEN